MVDAFFGRFSPGVVDFSPGVVDFSPGMVDFSPGVVDFIFADNIIFNF